MQSESKDNSENRKEKAQLIESMLEEVGMSKQELIDLLTNVVELEVDQSIEIDGGKLFVRGANLITGESVLNRKEMHDFLSRDQVMNLVSKVGLASMLVKARKLGLMIDDEIAELLGLDNKSKHDFQQFVEAIKNLSVDQANRASKLIEEQIRKFRDSSEREGGLMGKLMGSIKGTVDKATNKLKSTLHILDYKQDVEKLKQQARDVERAHHKLNRFEGEIRSRFEEVSKIKYKNGEVLASVDGLSSLVNLKEYLKSKGELTIDLAKLIDDAGSTATGMQKNIASLNRIIGQDIEHIGFDKAGKLMVEKILEGTKKKIHIEDYLGDMDRMSIERLRMKDKGEDDLERKRLLDLEELQLEGQENEVEISAEKLNKSVQKEIKYVKDDIVKIDIIADKAKILEAQKLMREGMKDMKEAEKNKDLLDNIKKEMQKNREIEK